MSVAVPTAKLSASSGLLDSFILMIGNMNWFVIIIGILFLYILVSEMISWALGVNYVADYAAKDRSSKWCIVVIVNPPFFSVMSVS